MSGLFIFESWSIDLPQYSAKSTSSNVETFTSYAQAVNGFYEIELSTVSRPRLYRFTHTGNYLSEDLPGGFTSFAQLANSFESIVGQRHNLVRVQQGSANREYTPARLVSFSVNSDHAWAGRMQCSFVFESMIDWAVLT